MKDLQDHLAGADPRWIKDKILYPYRNILDIKKGGFVKYPQSKGSPWKINAFSMVDFLQEHWSEYMSN